MSCAKSAEYHGRGKMGNVKDVLELVRTRKWDTLLMLGLMTVAIIAVPVWVTQKQKGIAHK